MYVALSTCLATCAHPPLFCVLQVLFVSLPWRGHVNALRSLARALLGRGFSVAFALPEVRLGFGASLQAGAEWQLMDFVGIRALA
jgi:hypothetical protein